MSNSTRAAELVATSKRKYSLGRARLRRDHIELALLSFHGSLEDALRSHLHLYGHPAAEGDWLTLFEAMHQEVPQPLAYEGAEHIWRMHKVQASVAQGDAITISLDTLLEYQQMAATVLIRYGVLVVRPDEHTTRPLSIPHAPLRWRFGEWWRQHRTSLLSAIGVMFIFLVGAMTTLVMGLNEPTPRSISGERPSPLTPVSPVVSNTSSPLNNATSSATEKTPSIPLDGLAPGVTAYVSAKATDGLALRAEPGTDPLVQIWFYLAPSSAVQIVSGPIQLEGHTWWKVRVANQEGWCSSEFLETH